MSFSDEWAKESEAAINALQETVKVTAISLFNGVVLSSPVGNFDLWKTKYKPDNYVGGQFRSNWFVSFNGPSDKITDDVRGKAARLREIVNIQSAPYSREYNLTNNLPYAQRLENGFSTQAPAGVVAPNISRIESKLPGVYSKIRKKYGV